MNGSSEPVNARGAFGVITGRVPFLRISSFGSAPCCKPPRAANPNRLKRMARPSRHQRQNLGPFLKLRLVATGGLMPNRALRKSPIRVLRNVFDVIYVLLGLAPGGPLYFGRLVPPPNSDDRFVIFGVFLASVFAGALFYLRKDIAAVSRRGNRRHLAATVCVLGVVTVLCGIAYRPTLSTSAWTQSLLYLAIWPLCATTVGTLTVMLAEQAHEKVAPPSPTDSQPTQPLSALPPGSRSAQSDLQRATATISEHMLTNPVFNAAIGNEHARLISCVDQGFVEVDAGSMLRVLERAATKSKRLNAVSDRDPEFFLSQIDDPPKTCYLKLTEDFARSGKNATRLLIFSTEHLVAGSILFDILKRHNDADFGYAVVFYPALPTEMHRQVGEYDCALWDIDLDQLSLARIYTVVRHEGAWMRKMPLGFQRVDKKVEAYLKLLAHVWLANAAFLERNADLFSSQPVADALKRERVLLQDRLEPTFKLGKTVPIEVASQAQPKEIRKAIDRFFSVVDKMSPGPDGTRDAILHARI
jgi:hypothetical protein